MHDRSSASLIRSLGKVNEILITNGKNEWKYEFVFVFGCRVTLETVTGCRQVQSKFSTGIAINYLI